MKRLFTSFIFFLILTPFVATAQFSVGFNATYQQFFGDGSTFALGEVDDLPPLYGGELRGSYGVGVKTAIKVGIMYRTSQKERFQYDIPAQMTDLSGDIKVQQYLLGDYNSTSGLYVFAGVSGNRLKVDWDEEAFFSGSSFEDRELESLATLVNRRLGLKTVSTSDSVFFVDQVSKRWHLNVGMGAEAMIGDRTFLFIEGQYVPMVKHMVDDTTIKEVPQQDFFSFSFGIRFAFGEVKRPW
ncbi:MAG: outer membrane beta-barrel protein [Bacteroidota bacterium]